MGSAGACGRFAVTATDNAGNSTSVTHDYTVAYDFGGFLSPVKSPNTVNTGKAGRTYPVKWQLRDASGSFISSLSAITGVTWNSTSCSSFAAQPSDALGTSATGGTSLHYDAEANQFVYNWATPASGCYILHLTLNDGQTYPAYFNLS